jgi:hypothetical protein
MLTNMTVNVVAVIHQPRYDVFDQFDDIVLLKTGGHCIYTGPRENVRMHNYLLDYVLNRYFRYWNIFHHKDTCLKNIRIRVITS